MKTVGIVVDFQEKLRKMSAFHAGHTFSDSTHLVVLAKCVSSIEIQHFTVLFLKIHKYPQYFGAKL